MLTEAEILQFIAEDVASQKKRMAAVGQRYYEAEHDILGYRLFYYNMDGKLVEDKARANIKIPHPFFTELVDQEVQYLLSNGTQIIKSDMPELQEELDKYFDDAFIAELTETVTGTVVKGFNYMHAYMGAEGRTSFQCADSTGVVEVREKDTDDGCAYVIYWYTDRITKENKKIKRIQVWDNTQTYFYVQEEEGKLEIDKSEPLNPRPHITYRKTGDKATYYDGFGFIPFFRLDNCQKQYSGLKPIKPIIDDYDLMACGLSNNLEDFDHPLHVVKGFMGSDLDELAVNLKTKKMIGVDDTGGVEVHTIDVPYQARLTKMQEDEKNIYRFGMGFNSAQLGDGNITNIVIKSRYALLDLKCSKLEIRLKQFLRKIIKVVLDEINKNNGTAYQMKDVYFDLQREIITNAADNAQIELTDAQRQQTQINTLLNLANVLDDETIVQSICEVLEIDYETIKDKLPTNEEKSLAEAQNILEGVLPNE